MSVILTVVLILITLELAVLVSWFALPLLWEQYRAYRDTPRLRQRLRELPFYAGLLVGRGQYHEIAAGQDGRIYADATYALLARHGGAVVGFIGFELQRGQLLVMQLQGIKGVNMRGLDLADYLLECAEAAGKALGAECIRVQRAEYNFYYHLGEQHRLYPERQKHQDRLERIYNLAPKKRGYAAMRRWFDKQVA